MRTRQLIDPNTAKVWGTQCKGETVLVRVGAMGKEKESAKPQADPKAALAWALQEEWKRLKKGFLLHNPSAAVGEPLMHRYRGPGYTGALPVGDVAGQLLGNHNDEKQEADSLFLVDEAGAVSTLPELPPQRLAWKACYVPALEKLLIQADHSVLSWDVGAPEYKTLCKHNPNPVSCLDAAGTRAVWYEEPDLVVSDLTTGEVLMRQKMPYELYSGHSLQMEAALSPDGSTVACCAHTGEIALIDVATGQTRASLGGFEIVAEMTYTPDARYLIVREQYGQWAHLCFDLSTFKPRVGWFPDKGGARNTFALSPEGTRIAFVEGSYIEIYDFATLKRQARFPVEHVVRTCAIAWVGRSLGVQTDQGCASLYAVA